MTRPPSGCASIAFWRRLMRTCLIFSPSRGRSGRGRGGRRRARATRAAPASGWRRPTTSSTRASRLAGRCWRRPEPENLRKSPTRLSSLLTSSRITARRSSISRATEISRGAERRSRMESWRAMEFRGFRISCARPAAKVPTTASFSLSMIRAWAARSPRRRAAGVLVEAAVLEGHRRLRGEGLGIVDLVRGPLVGATGPGPGGRGRIAGRQGHEDPERTPRFLQAAVGTRASRSPRPVPTDDLGGGQRAPLPAGSARSGPRCGPSRRAESSGPT